MPVKTALTVSDFYRAHGRSSKGRRRSRREVFRIHAKGVRVDTDIAKVSVVGVGMRTHAGVAAMMLRPRGRRNNPTISTSEIKISVVIDAKQSDHAGAPCTRSSSPIKDDGKDVLLYDTTLRDGCQAEDISFTLEDKLRIAAKLDELASITSKAISRLQ